MAPRAAWAALAVILLACCASPVATFTKPDQLQILTAFRDTMLARSGQQNWTKALASWTCPTDPANSVGGACDPCSQEVWGNWEHLACRGPRVTYTKFRVPGDGDVTNVHITDYFVEGTVPIKELCPLKGLTEFDLDGGSLTGTIPTEFSSCYPDLIEIDLSYNKLSGGLPKEIALNENLEQWKVEHNELTGTIPSEYGGMAALNWLRLSDNRLTGKVPETFRSTALRLNQLTLDNNGFEGNLYVLSGHYMVNFNAADNPKMCGMVPVGIRFAHSFNFLNTRLGLPCPEEVAGGWTDLSETL